MAYSRMIFRVFLLFLVIGATVNGQIDLKKTTPHTIRITDKNGQPIPNAKVWVWRWKDNSGKSISVALSSNPPLTNEKGELDINVPAGAVAASISSAAKGFSKGDGNFTLNGIPELALERGAVVNVRVVNADGTPQPDGFVLLQDCRIRGTPEFKKDPGKGPAHFVSPTIKPERRWMRVFHLSDEGILFSPLIDTRKPAEADPDGTIIAKLGPGIRLEGKLDDTVPRPVKTGVVELYISEREDHQIGDGWTWQETTEVKPDGTFVFESLPTGGHAQMVALVDGYQSSRPKVEELQAYLAKHGLEDNDLTKRMAQRRDAFWPHLIPLPQGESTVSATLPCQPTGAIDLRVIDSSGNPIAGAEATVNPNGHFLGGERLVVGTGFSTKWMVVKNWYAAWTKSPIRKWANDLIRVKTDETGLAQLRNLPNDHRVSIKVTASGFEMPIRPSYPSGRYYSQKTESGKTLQRTLTMEPRIDRVEREILVVNHDGSPAKNIQISVMELTTDNAPNDWQYWSIPRFGPIASQKTDEQGIVRLQVPSKIGEKTVKQLRVIADGRPTRGTYLRKQELTIPPKDDGRVISLAISAKAPPPRVRDQMLDANYIDPNATSSETPGELIAKLITKPSLSALRVLLTQQGFDDATPISFAPDRNGFDDYRDKRPVEAIDTEFGKRVVVLANVRPKDAAWKTKPEGRFPPQAVFVFQMDGQLEKMIGGTQSSGRDYCSASLCNYGGTDDALVRVSFFEEHGPFEYVAKFFHIGLPEKPLMTLHGHANAFSWSQSTNATVPPAEIGWISFKFNGQDVEDSICGTTLLASEVPRRIYWDGVNNRFIGPEEQSVGNKPLYRVDKDNSQSFRPVEVLLGQAVVAGGRTSFEPQHVGLHGWQVAIPTDSSGVVKLLSVSEESNKEIARQELGAGCSFVSLWITDAEEGKSNIELQVPKESNKSISIPRIASFEEPSVADQRIYRAFDEENVLMDRATTIQGIRIVLKIEVEKTP